MNLNSLGIALNYDCWLWFPKGFIRLGITKTYLTHFQPTNNPITSYSGKIYVCNHEEKEKLLGTGLYLI